MTREVAIEKLELMRQKVDEETYRALVLAIKALEQEPKAEKPMCDRNICLNNEYNGIGCDECIVNKAEQEPCKDAEQIDYHDDFETASRKIHDYEERQKQNDKKCGSYNNTNTFKSCCDCKLIGTDSCYMVCGGSKSLYKPKQKSEPCTDAVSRKPNCIDCIHKSVCFRLDMREDSDYAEKCGDFLTESPPVTQKSGKWIIIDDCEKFIAKCSECGRIEDSRMIGKYPYCHCGARMESEDKE